MNILLFGATGMVGDGVLRCLIAVPGAYRTTRPHTPPPPRRTLHQFVRPCNLCKWNALADLEPGPPRLKRFVQIPRRRHLSLCREIVAPQKKHADVLEHHQPERDIGRSSVG